MAQDVVRNQFIIKDAVISGKWKKLHGWSNPYYTEFDMSTSTTRFDQAILRAAVGGKRVRVAHAGVRAVVVPEEDALLLEAIENYLDVKNVKARRARSNGRRESLISWSVARKKIGI